MRYSMKAEVEVIADNNTSTNVSTHVATNFSLQVSKNLSQIHYNDSDGMPTKAGSEGITQCLVEGLIGNIHMAHQKGFRDSAEHLRYIIDRLETGFIAQGTVSKGVM